MKKISLTVLFMLVSLPLFAQSIQYVYRNTYSSENIENLKKGAVYTDENKDLFIIRKIYKDVSVFDHIYTSHKITAENEITERGKIYTLTVSGLNEHVGANFSFTSPLYPLKPIFSAGFSFVYKEPFVRAGFTYCFALNRLFNTEFTLLEDANLEASLQGGLLIGKYTIFEIYSSVGYRHNLKNFVWGFDVYGTSRLSKSLYQIKVGFTATVGVNL